MDKTKINNDNNELLDFELDEDIDLDLINFDRDGFDYTSLGVEEC
jgi:hypothetical protein